MMKPVFFVMILTILISGTVKASDCEDQINYAIDEFNQGKVYFNSSISMIEESEIHKTNWSFSCAISTEVIKEIMFGIRHFIRTKDELDLAKEECSNRHARRKINQLYSELRSSKAELYNLNRHTRSIHRKNCSN